VNLLRAVGRLNQTIFHLLHCFNAGCRVFGMQSGKNTNRKFLGKKICLKKHKTVMYMMDFFLAEWFLGRFWLF